MVTTPLLMSLLSDSVRTINHILSNAQREIYLMQAPRSVSQPQVLMKTNSASIDLLATGGTPGTAIAILPAQIK